MAKHKKLTQCPTCGTELGCHYCNKTLSQMGRAFLRRLGASLLSLTRPAATLAGPPKIMKACKFCKIKFGVADMRRHLPRCTARPNR